MTLSIDELHLKECELRADAHSALAHNNYELAAKKCAEAVLYQTEQLILLGHIPQNTKRARLGAGK